MRVWVSVRMLIAYMSVVSMPISWCYHNILCVCRTQPTIISVWSPRLREDARWQKPLSRLSVSLRRSHHDQCNSICTQLLEQSWTWTVHMYLRNTLVRLRAYSMNVFDCIAAQHFDTLLLKFNYFPGVAKFRFHAHFFRPSSFSCLSIYPGVLIFSFDSLFMCHHHLLKFPHPPHAPMGE